MTTNDIDAIEARANAATPGPWGYDPDNTGLCFGPHIGLLNSNGVAVQIHHRSDEDAAQSYATAAFIADARQDVPALCAEVRELRAANERALRLLERVAAWRSGAVGSEWTAELSADIAALIYPDLPKMEGDK